MQQRTLAFGDMKTSKDNWPGSTTLTKLSGYGPEALDPVTWTPLRAPTLLPSGFAQAASQACMVLLSPSRPLPRAFDAPHLTPSVSSMGDPDGRKI